MAQFSSGDSADTIVAIFSTDNDNINNENGNSFIMNTTDFVAVLHQTKWGEGGIGMRTQLLL